MEQNENEAAFTVEQFQEFMDSISKFDLTRIVYDPYHIAAPIKYEVQ